MLREITSTDLEKIRGWRNSPDVRKVMFTDHVISKEEHVNWWNSVRNDGSKKILIFCQDGKDHGVVNFYDIDKNKSSCHWGFYLSNDLTDGIQRIKIWQVLEAAAIKYAFKVLNCSLLISESFGFNKPVLEMHKRFGFEEVGVEFRIKNGDSHKVIVSELTLDRYIKLYETPDSNPEDPGSKVKGVYRRFSSKIALLSSANMDFLSNEFMRCAKSYHINLSITDIPFGQYRIEANTPDSKLRIIDHDALFFVESIDDLIPFDTVLSVGLKSTILKKWELYIQEIKLLRQKLTGLFFVALPVHIAHWVTSKDVSSEDFIQLASLKQIMRDQLIKLSNEQTDIYLMDFDDLLSKVGRGNAQPGKYKYLARSPFSGKFNIALSSYMLGLLLYFKGKTSRLLVLDLDNTLWQGVIGDDGVQGIGLGGDYPGNIHKVLQSLFLLFKHRGIALAIASKNTESVAIDALKNHPEMVLCLDDFVTYRINWSPKSGNIVEIASELGLGLDAICFIDDNPIEREEVRHVLPDVFVPELPAELSDWPDYISNLPELFSFNLTEEDRQRSASYKLRAEIQKSPHDSKERESFLDSLDIVLHIEVYSETNKKRILQLINKTNQFNVTIRRHTESDLENLLGSGECFAIRVTDNMGSNEIVGVLIIVFHGNTATIDTFLLSCRVLGRGVETAVLAWLCQHMKNLKITIIHGEILATERNKPVQELFKDHGFTITGESKYNINVYESVIEKPYWIRIEEAGI